MPVDVPLLGGREEGRVQSLERFQCLQCGARESGGYILVIILHENLQRQRREILVFDRVDI